jgi:hypothetical protein
MNTETITLRGSCGALIISARTGEILDRSQADSEYDSYAWFNPRHLSTPYDVEAFDDFDICYIGSWNQDGVYDPPAIYERDDGAGGLESFKPRWVGGYVPIVTGPNGEPTHVDEGETQQESAATKKIRFTAEHIIYVECVREVPADMSDEDIAALRDDLDGAEYHRTGEDWENGQWYEDGDPVEWD